MGTHPIFESDFDCLTEGILTFGGAQLNHQKGSESHPEGKIFKKEILTQRDESPLINLYREV